MYEIITQLPFNGFQIKGTLTFPVKAKSLVIFSAGLGSIHGSPHEQKMARKFQDEGFGTLLFDFPEKHERQSGDRENIDMLSQGLFTTTSWLNNHSEYKSFELAYFGSGTGAATALKTACDIGESLIKTVVSLSGRLDLVKEILPKVPCPTLLIVGELDFKLVKFNKQATKHLKVENKLAVVPGASHLFEEPGKRKEAAGIAASWYKKHLSYEVQNLEFRI